MTKTRYYLPKEVPIEATKEIINEIYSHNPYSFRIEITAESIYEIPTIKVEYKSYLIGTQIET